MKALIVWTGMVLLFTFITLRLVFDQAWVEAGFSAGFLVLAILWTWRLYYLWRLRTPPRAPPPD